MIEYHNTLMVGNVTLLNKKLKYRLYWEKMIKMLIRIKLFNIYKVIKYQLMWLGWKCNIELWFKFLCRNFRDLDRNYCKVDKLYACLFWYNYLELSKSLIHELIIHFQLLQELWSTLELINNCGIYFSECLPALEKK